MTRLQKKCLVGSTGFHALLCLVLFAGPAFLLSKDRVEEMPPINLISARLVDEALSGGGGSPNAAPPAQPAVQRTTPPPKPVAQPEPRHEQPKPEPPAPRPVEHHESRKARPAPEPEEEFPLDVDAMSNSHSKPKSTKHAIEPSFTIKKSSPAANKAQLEAKAKAEEQARVKAIEMARLEAVNNSLNKIHQNLSGGTTVEMAGPGGEAYVNYGQFVKAIYDDAWIPPDEAADDSQAVKVQVVIGRNGDVLSSKVLTKSGVSSLDRSVQKTLHRVKFVAPFPEGAKEEQRTFKLNFNLKAKRQLG